MRRPCSHPPLINVAHALPALQPLARTAVRLHPRPDHQAPPSNSNLGAGFLWPLHEPLPHSQTDGRPLTFVAQLLRSDLPEISFPASADLLQIFWKAEFDEWWDDPECAILWRSSAGTTPRHPPGPAPLDDLALIPKPCALFPERVLEYPHTVELPPNTFAALPEPIPLIHPAPRQPLLLEERYVHNQAIWRKNFPEIYHFHSTAPGTKAAGWADWIQDANAKPRCPICNGPTDHLLTLASMEFQYDSRWEAEPYQDGMDPCAMFTGLSLGDGGNLYLFYCEQCPQRPARALFQCS